MKEWLSINDIMKHFFGKLYKEKKLEKTKEERELEEIRENIRRLRIIKRDLEKAGR